MKKYMIEVDSFRAEIDAEAIARGIVRRCAALGHDPQAAVDDAIEDALSSAFAAYQPDMENPDGGLEGDVRAAIRRLSAVPS